MEEKGILKNKFHRKFRRRTPWKIDPAQGGAS
jgi:hypothetical protein